MVQKVRIEPLRLFGSIFPIVNWSRSYDLDAAVGDLIAGVTVALTLVPQSIAYASLAGLEPQYGLYSSFIGGFVYAVTGTVPQINIGPTALLSLLTFTYTHGVGPEYAALLALVSGIVQLLVGAAQLGFLVEFVSLPVVSGFTSAAAITIACSQIKGLLGLKYSAESFLEIWRQLVRHVGETRGADTGLSVGCIIVLVAMKALKDIPIPEPQEPSKKKRVAILRKSLWVAGVARNAVVVLLASVIAFCVHESTDQPFILTGHITPGLPAPQAPPLTSSLGSMLSHLGSGLIVVPLVGIISNVAIAKAFSNGRAVRATQEILALGACNVVGAFFSSLPVNGSFTRSAVSHASAVRTPAAGFYTGIIILLTLALLTPFFYYIPRATLSAVIICAVLHMVDYHIVVKLWRSNRVDLIPLIGTFVSCLGLGIEIGLICGVAVDVVILMYYNSRPNLDVRVIDDGYIPRHYALRPIGGLHFAATERLRSKVLALRDPNNKAFPPKMDKPLQAPRDVTIVLTDVQNNTKEMIGSPVDVGNTVPPKLLVLYCEGLYRMDYTCLQGLKLLYDDWTKSGTMICFQAKEHIKKEIISEIPNMKICDTMEQLCSAFNSTTEPANGCDTQL